MGNKKNPKKDSDSFIKNTDNFNKFWFKDQANLLKGGDWWRLFLGSMDPFSTGLWNIILDRDDEPLINQLGGPFGGSSKLGLGNDGGVYKRARESGEVSPAAISDASKGHDVAEVIAAIYGAAGAAGAGGAGGAGAGGSGNVFGVGMDPFTAASQGIMTPGPLAGGGAGGATVAGGTGAGAGAGVGGALTAPAAASGGGASAGASAGAGVGGGSSSFIDIMNQFGGMPLPGGGGQPTQPQGPDAAAQQQLMVLLAQAARLQAERDKEEKNTIGGLLSGPARLA